MATNKDSLITTAKRVEKIAVNESLLLERQISEIHNYLKFKVSLDGHTYQENLDRLTPLLKELEDRLEYQGQIITRVYKMINEIGFKPKKDFTCKLPEKLNKASSVTTYRLDNFFDSDQLNRINRLSRTMTKLTNKKRKELDYRNYQVEIVVTDRTEVNKLNNQPHWVLADKETEKLTRLDWSMEYEDYKDNMVETQVGNLIYYTVRGPNFEIRLGKSTNIFEVVDLSRNQIIWTAYK